MPESSVLGRASSSAMSSVAPSQASPAAVAPSVPPDAACQENGLALNLGHHLARSCVKYARAWGMPLERC